MIVMLTTLIKTDRETRIGKPIYVNTNHIIFMEKDRDGTLITLIDDKKILVKETPVDILNKKE